MPWLRLLVTFRGSSLERTWKRIASATVLSIVVTVMSEGYEFVGYSFTTAPFALIGVALGIFLGFRNNTSYDRFWEGRKLWGALVNTARTIARQVETILDPPGDNQTAGLRETMTWRTIAFCHALRMHLREEDCPEELIPFVPSSDYEAIARVRHRPLMLIRQLGGELRTAKAEGRVDLGGFLAIEQQLTELANIMGGCERIKATPIPFAYNVLLHRLVAFYCFFLPFGLVDTVHHLTPLVVFLVSHVFFGMDSIGEEIENPFDDDPNALPLSAICRTIEINLREVLGETDLPPPLRPIDGVLR